MRGLTVVEVPQWRGSGAVTAKRLVEGARLLGELVGADRVAAGDDWVGAGTERMAAGGDQAGDGAERMAGGGNRVKDGAERVAGGGDQAEAGAGRVVAGGGQAGAGVKRVRADMELLSAGIGRVRVEVDDDLAVTASRVREALAKVGDGFVVTVGGDCGVELEPVAAVRRKYGDRLVVVWFDAHGDLNTPESSPSGAYHGMVLRALMGEGPAGLVADPAVDPRRVVLAGVRDLDPGEVEFVASSGIGHVRTADPQALIRAVVAASGRGTPGREAESIQDLEGEEPGREIASLEESGREVLGLKGSGGEDLGRQESGWRDPRGGAVRETAGGEQEVGGTRRGPQEVRGTQDRPQVVAASEGGPQVVSEVQGGPQVVSEVQGVTQVVSEVRDVTQVGTGGEGGSSKVGGQGRGPVVYVHVDLDVLEPEVFGSVGSPVPGGLLPEELVRMVAALGERFEVVGLGITEYEPGGTDDFRVLAPVVKALVEGCQPGRTAPR